MSYLKEHDEHVSVLFSPLSYSVVYLSSYLGTLELELCDQCPFVKPRCTHENNTWNEAGTQLTCNLCGVGGT